MKKKLIILFIIVTSLFAVMSVGVFAYFTITSNTKTININHDFDGDLIEIDSFGDLYNYSVEHKYNDSNDIEDLNNASRKTLKLTENIILTEDLYITSNVSLDLNAKYLYLNGHSLTFNYGYFGTTEIYSNAEFGFVIPNEVDGDLNEVNNGSVGHIEIMSKNNILLTTKNIKVQKPNGALYTASDYIKVLDYNSKYYSYDIFKMVSNVLEDDYLKNVKRLPYLSLNNNANITLNDSVYSFNSKLFIDDYVLDGSAYFDLATANNTISFVTSDIDLPFNYLNDDKIEIEYVSSDEEVINKYGKVLDNSANKIVTLTVNVKDDGEVVGTCDFFLYVFDSSSSARNRAIKASLYSYFKSHYDTENDYFEFEREKVIPRSLFGLDISYQPYRITSNQDGIVLFDGETTKYASLGVGNIIEIEGDTNYYSFIPTSETSALTITYGSETLAIKVYSANLVVNNETSIGRALINDWYGGKIELSKLDLENNIYESQILYSYDDIDRSVYPEITALSYELINDRYDLYQISDLSNNQQLLSVKPGKIPENFVQTSVLSINLTVSGKDINLQLGIAVKTPSEDTQNAFLPYYTYFDELIKDNYNYYISKKFEMPFSYNTLGPIIVYDFAVLPNDYESLSNQELSINTADTNVFNIDLYYNGRVQYTFTFTAATSYTDALNTFLGTDEAKRATKLKEILSYGDAKYIFTLKPDYVASKNVRFGFVYNYKNNYSSNSWITYCKNTTSEQIVSKVTIAGILKYGTDVYDETFYKWIYDKFVSVDNSDVYTLGDYPDNYVLIDSLNQSVDLDASLDNTLASVTDFRGLKYLKGTRKLILVNSSGTGLITNAEAAITIAREIAEMSNLEYLDLTGCIGFTDGKDASSANDYDNDSVSRFIALRNLKYLNMNECNIISFNFMDSMTWLSEAHVVNQVISADNNYSNFYGNTGIANYQVFNDLTDAGVKVYNTKQGSADALFERDKNINDYIRIKNGILYQSILKDGISIDYVYSGFSTTPSDYHLSTAYGTMNVTSSSLTFRPVLFKLTEDTEINTSTTYFVKSDTASGFSQVANPVKEDLARYYVEVRATSATAFEAVYSFTLSDNSSTFIVSLIVKFHVERY